MAWQDRIRQAAYTSPSGERITFTYEDVSKSVDKKTSAFEFPDADGTFIQDLGHSGRKFPLRVIITGDDYDLTANAFDAALEERGPGKLEHPIYGTRDVVPFGSIRRRDDLRSAGNQAIIDVTFWETIGLVYPTAQDDPAADVLEAVTAYNGANAEQFAQSTSLTSAVEQAIARTGYTDLLDRTRNGLNVIADTQTDVKRAFDVVYDSINLGIDTLIGQPLNLAFQTSILIQTPARALTSIKARLSAYRDLAESIIGATDAIQTPSLDSQPLNKFKTDDLYATGYITGSIVSSLNTEFTTRPEAVSAAAEIIDQFEQVNDWRDSNFRSLAETDTGEAYQQLQLAAALAAGYLVELSFSLKQERTVVLDRNRTIIDLAAELYGTVDPELDLLINSNNLSGSEIIELPAGREILYYV